MDNPWGSPWADPASRTPSPSRASVFSATNFLSKNVTPPQSLPPQTPFLDLSDPSPWSVDDDDGFGDWADSNSQEAAFGSSFTSLQQDAYHQRHDTVVDKHTPDISLTTQVRIEPIPAIAIETKSSTTTDIDVDPWATADIAASPGQETQDESTSRLSEDISSLASIKDEVTESPTTSIAPSELKVSLEPEPEILPEPTPESTFEIRPESSEQPALEPQTNEAPGATPKPVAPLEPSELVPQTSSEVPKVPKLSKYSDGSDSLNPRKTRNSVAPREPASSRVQSLVSLYDGIARTVSQGQISPVMHTGRHSHMTLPDENKKPDSEEHINTQTKSAKEAQICRTDATEESPNNQAECSTENKIEVEVQAEDASKVQMHQKPKPDGDSTSENIEEVDPASLTVTKVESLNCDEVLSEQVIVQEPVPLLESPEQEKTSSEPSTPSSLDLIPRSRLPKDVDMGAIDELFQGLCDPPATTREVLPETIYDSFVTTSERRTWLRVSRHGSTRRHKFADDANYRPVKWAGSATQKDTVNIVRRWMEEGSTVGRVMSSLHGLSAPVMKAPTKMFSWNDTSASDPVDMSALTERLQLKKSAKERSQPRPISVPGFRGFHAPVSSTSSIVSPTTPVRDKADAFVFSITPPQPPGSAPKDATPSSASSRSSLEIKNSTRSLAAGSKHQPPASDVVKEAEESTVPQPQADDKTSTESSFKPTEDVDDDDDWGEMVDSSSASFSMSHIQDDSFNFESSSFGLPSPLNIPSTLQAVYTPSHSVYASGASSPVTSLAPLSPGSGSSLSPRSRQNSFSGSILSSHGLTRPYTPSPLSATSMMYLPDLAVEKETLAKSSAQLPDFSFSPDASTPIGSAMLASMSPMSPSESFPTISSPLRHTVDMESFAAPLSRCEDNTPKPTPPPTPMPQTTVLVVKQTPMYTCETAKMDEPATSERAVLGAQDRADVQKILGGLTDLSYMLQ
ncbi:uncharacterized protein BROUX77_000361 [Berkeleyomyces rouxiae]|uniref:uncharacterized protein n=1 Tax=Berkeleyomyces rouxiae TaxID=2035830 RepID=UPI003B7FBA4B